MKQEIINGGNARYLGELERFKDGIPFGIVNKTKTDVGGTYPPFSLPFMMPSVHRIPIASISARRLTSFNCEASAATNRP